MIRTLAAGLLAGTAFIGHTPASGTEPTIPVIVFLKSSPGTTAGGVIRSGEENMARQDGATGLRGFGLASAFSARMTRAAAASLAARPDVARVIPDSIITGPARVPAEFAPRAAGAMGTERAAVPPPTMPGACDSAGSATEPEGLALTHTDAAHRAGYTGRGVKIAFLADGLDPGNVNFQRNGKSAITDYQDFSGDGPGTPTNGDEAFLDANAIAGQGKHVYDTRGFSSAGPAGPCPTRIEGTAPGADVTALKVFGQQNQTMTSSFLQAISYAVMVDHVSVLNESFGSNPFPDVTSLDAVKEFNDAATRLGVTVIVSSGDAGPFNTVDSPSSDPNVLSAGASTAYRFYAQTDYAEANSFARRGWLSNGVSSLSSAGITQDGRTVSMVAPGDLGWASCTANPRLYAGCVGFTGHPSPIEESGGTSQAAPEIAGAAALVIGAYRSAHRGASPSPAMVRQILTSSASDLGAPADEQGTGLLDSDRAVRLARGLPGSTPLLTDGQLNYTGPAGSRHTWKVQAVNASRSPETLSLAGRAFGPPRTIASSAATLSDTASPHVTSPAGIPDNYEMLRFRVPAGAARLDASIAWPAAGSASRDRKPVRLDLVSPDGKFAGDSIPQGNSGYGTAQVLHPAAGVWQAYVVSSESAGQGTTGRVLFGATVSGTRNFGTVSPRRLTLAPGATGSFTFSAAAPGGAGDTSGAVMLRSAGGTTALPVTLRGLIPFSSSSASSASPARVVSGRASLERALTRPSSRPASPESSGRFSGVLTGGNGRVGGGGQSAAYQFTVGHGVRGVQAGVTLARDPGDEITGYLVSPDGQVMGYGTNQLITGFSAKGEPQRKPGRSLSVSAVNPAAGTWTLVLDFASSVDGAELADPFTGTVRLAGPRANGARAARGVLPDSASARLDRGRAYRYRIAVTNTGPAPEDVFTDPRLNRAATYTLRLQGRQEEQELPLPPIAADPTWLVPPQTSSVTVHASSAVPVTFDFAPLNGEPDTAAPTGTSVSATYPEGPLPTPVTPGLWQAFPSQAGPYPAAGAGHVTARLSMTARTLAFDPAMSSGDPAAKCAVSKCASSDAAGTADVWRYALSPVTGMAARRMFTIGAGQTRVITVTVRPTAARGTVVRGTLYVDTFADTAQFFSGSQLQALPYEYRVK